MPYWKKILDKHVKTSYIHRMENTTGNVGGKKKILVVEDDFYIREIYQMEAEYEGYIVIAAADGQEAIEKVKLERPDLVLLDLMLPKVDGITVLKTIKSDPQLQHIPCVILTNLEDEAKKQEAKDAGAANYILKVQGTPQSVIRSLSKYF